MKNTDDRNSWIMAVTFCLAVSSPVFAAERTVCFRLQMRDDRTNCATPSETGARRPCNQGAYVDMEGHQYELWDKDFSSDDERIGTWYIGGPGTRCVTFEWENASYSKGEAHPDVYIRYINRVNRTGYSNYIHVEGVDTDGSTVPKTTWRNGQSGDTNRYVAMNCGPRETCFIFPSGTMVPTNDIASERGLRIMALDSSQHALQAFGEVMDRNVNLHYPGQASCPTSCAIDREEIHITRSQGNSGVLVAHEIGHTVQMQEFNQDSLRNDCSRNGNGWGVTSVEHESCATTEGWASYVGVTAWYEPNDTGAVPIGWGLDFERAQPQSSDCETNAHIALQVAKGFWDFDDWNNEAGVSPADGDDRLAYNTLDITRGWRQFPDGTGNRQDFESGQDGVNTRDYWWNNDHRFTAPGAFETLIEHNCLQAQDNN